MCKDISLLETENWKMIIYVQALRCADTVKTWFKKSQIPVDNYKREGTR